MCVVTAELFFCVHQQKLITLRGEKQAIESQLNRMQHKVKDLGEDFRARLVKYVEDISVGRFAPTFFGSRGVSVRLITQCLINKTKEYVVAWDAILVVKVKLSR